MSMVPVTTTSSLDDMIRLGNIFRKSGYFKNVTDEAQAVTKILYGQELGFSPVVSMMGIYIVDGKPALSGNLLGALVKRSGRYDYIVKALTNDECAIDFKQRSDGKWQSIGTFVFTMKDAQIAGLPGKDSWRKYPKAMLFNRALSAGVRAFCPDVAVSAVYVPEELGAEVSEEGEVISMPETASGVFQESVELPPLAGAVAETAVVVEPPEVETEFINSKQRSTLARRFRESLKPELQNDENELRHKALTALHFSKLFKSQFLDDGGNPTSEFVLATEYEAVGKALVKAAKSV